MKRSIIHIPENTPNEVLSSEVDKVRAKLEVLGRMKGSDIEWPKAASSEVYEALTRLTGKREKLCKNGCHFWFVIDSDMEDLESYCTIDLYPVTADGKDCPYWKVKG